VAIAIMVGGSGCGGGGSTSTRGGSTRSASTSRANGTRVVYVRPTTKRGSLKPGYALSERLNGGPCLPSVDVVGGTYECSVGNKEYGPCWSLGDAANTREVFCLHMPWEHRGVEIQLQLKPSERMIWDLELTTGQRCSPLHGAVGMYSGVPIDFSCAQSDLELLGQPNKAPVLWTIQEVVAHTHKEAALSHEAGPLGRIAVAWYGD
jgi:hypothetical protein